MHYKYISLEERIKDYKNTWHDHVLRVDSSRLTQKVKNYLSLPSKKNPLND
jgi:hypothetical protein